MSVGSIPVVGGRNDVMAVVRTHAEYQLVLNEHVCAGTRLFTIDGNLTRTPTRYSVQVGRDLHIDMPDGYASEEILDRFFWRFTNHSCEPNAIVRGRQFVALKCIDPWNQITFDYNTTEWDMAEPFDCLCGTDSCVKVVRGYRWLDHDARARIAPLLSDHMVTLAGE